MTKQQKQNNLLTCLQVACEQVPEVRVYFDYDKATDIYQKKVYLYSSDRAVTTFQKTLEILNCGFDVVESIDYINEYGICEICLKKEGK